MLSEAAVQRLPAPDGGAEEAWETGDRGRDAHRRMRRRSASLSPVPTVESSTKLVVRKLPPNVRKEDVEQMLDKFQHSLSWFSFHKMLQMSSNPLRIHQMDWRRFYVFFEKWADAESFIEDFKQRTFEYKGKVYKPIVEIAPSQQLPKAVSSTADSERGSILEDEDYLQFVEDLTKEAERVAQIRSGKIDPVLVAVAEMQRHAADDENRRSGYPMDSTPLAAFVAAKHKADSRPKARRMLKAKDKDDVRKFAKSAKSAKSRCSVPYDGSSVAAKRREEKRLRRKEERRRRRREKRRRERERAAAKRPMRHPLPDSIASKLGRSSFPRQKWVEKSSVSGTRFSDENEDDSFKRPSKKEKKKKFRKKVVSSKRALSPRGSEHRHSAERVSEMASDRHRREDRRSEDRRSGDRRSEDRRQRDADRKRGDDDYYVGDVRKTESRVYDDRFLYETTSASRRKARGSRRGDDYYEDEEMEERSKRIKTRASSGRRSSRDRYYDD